MRLNVLCEYQDKISEFIGLDHNIWVGDKCAISIDLTRYMRGAMITNINALPEFRGQKLASQALDRLCASADQHGIPLYLEVASRGGLSYDELTKWYESRGFMELSGTGMYARRPKAASWLSCPNCQQDVSPDTTTNKLFCPICGTPLSN